MLEEIRRQTKDLLAYYPGRDRIALLWLIVIPVLSFLVFTMCFGKISRVTSGGIPTYMFYMAGQSFNWIYKLSLVITLIRICHSERKRLLESVQIIGSSVSYSLVVGLPYVLLTFVWVLFHVGTSPIALFQVLVGLVCAVGALLLILVCLGSLGHRFGIVIPFLLFLTAVYPYLLPVFYPASAVLSRWQLNHAFAIPLSPTITILRKGMLNQGLASSSLWLAALLHALVGYGLAVWIWKKNTEPEDRQLSSESAHCASPDEVSS